MRVTPALETLIPGQERLDDDMHAKIIIKRYRSSVRSGKTVCPFVALFDSVISVIRADADPRPVPLMLQQSGCQALNSRGSRLTSFAGHFMKAGNEKEQNERHASNLLSLA